MSTDREEMQAFLDHFSKTFTSPHIPFYYKLDKKQKRQKQKLNTITSTLSVIYEAG